MNSGRVLTLEHGGELWVRLADVHPMQDKIIALESKLDSAAKREAELTRAWESKLYDYGEQVKTLSSRLDQATKLVNDIKRDLLDRGRYDPVLGGKVVDLSNTLFNRLCIFIETVVERQSGVCPRPGCPHVGKPDFSIGNPCRCE